MQADILHNRIRNDQRVIELDGSRPPGQIAPYNLLQDGYIVVLRNVPEIHELGVTLRSLAERFGGPERAPEVAELMRNGDVASLETLAIFYRAFRLLRDSRYVSCLFSDLVGSFGLPAPVLIDSGYCRMVVPSHHQPASTRPDLFDPQEFQPRGPNDAEGMICGRMWGNAHRDIDVRHYHFQINLWFPLHNVDEDRTLLLFPDAYRRDVPQYGKLQDPTAPDNWGFGPALRVQLRFGDVLLFHSQQFHASPSQSLDRNRFSVEIRVAAACIDDNARIYRRLFWNIENFQPAATDTATSSILSRDLTETDSEIRSMAHAFEGRTAHAVVHRLFRGAASSLAVGYIHRSPEILDDAIDLAEPAWQSLVSRLESLPSGEDLWFMLARIAARQKRLDAVSALVERICARTQSYFWALEAGRLAAENGIFAPALSCFERAKVLADASGVTLDRYVPGMPPPRSRGQTFQLLPDAASRAAKAFAALARKELTSGVARTPSFDHRIFCRPDPIAVASFENYNLVSAAGLIVALPSGWLFSPEKLLASRAGLVVAGQSVEEVTAALGDRLGRALPVPLPVPMLPSLLRNYRLNALLGNYVVRPLRAVPGLRKLWRWWRVLRS